MTPAQKRSLELIAAIEQQALSLGARLEYLEAQYREIVGLIPIDYLQRHDADGATGPTGALNLAAAMRDYAADRWKLIDENRRLSAQRAVMRLALETIETELKREGITEARRKQNIANCVRATRPEGVPE